MILAMCHDGALEIREVEDLRRQLGKTVERDGLSKLMGGMGLTFSQARMILVLYYRGDWVEAWLRLRTERLLSYAASAALL